MISFLKESLDVHSNSFKKTFKTLAKRRLLGEPLSYITNRISFWDNDFFIDQRVLKPRIETEQIVSFVANIATKYLEQEVNILDIGCGCGAIGISSALLFKKPNLVLADVSTKALEVCQINTRLLGRHKYKIIQSDLWSKIPKTKFDIITANLPYLNSDISWDQSTNFEPHIALEGGSKDGLSLYRKFIKDIDKYSHSKTYVIIESDRWQQPALEKMMLSKGFELNWQDYFISAFCMTAY